MYAIYGIYGIHGVFGYSKTLYGSTATFLEGDVFHTSVQEGLGLVVVADPPLWIATSCMEGSDPNSLEGSVGSILEADGPLGAPPGEVILCVPG